MNNYSEIDVSKIDLIEQSMQTNNLVVSRSMLMRLTQRNHEVTLIVIGYNRLGKVKNCIESILRYTTGVDYELLLIDNGSTDGTLEYFLSVEYSHKRIIRITKNLGAFYPLMSVDFNSLGDFFCILNDDACVTPHWLTNLLTCIKSDLKIGLAAPMYSDPDHDIDDVTTRTFSGYEDMLQKIEDYNISDSKKWWDMVRPSTFCSLFRKEAVLSIGWPHFDIGFHHEFADDDVGFRLRRMGYRTIKAGDTWIYHDHNRDQNDDRNELFKKSFKIGEKNFKEKYFGLEWKDYINFYFPYLRQLSAPIPAPKMSVLGVDVKCGTAVLDVKNWLYSFGIPDIKLSAFTRDPKYWVDLKTICSGSVVCDREEFLLSDFPSESFDYVVADNPINCYHEPQVMLQSLFQLCKKGGYVICRLFNAFSFREYMTLLEGQGKYTARKISYNISLERFRSMLEGYGKVQCQFDVTSKAEEELDQFFDWVPDQLTETQRKSIKQMQNASYLFVAEKKASD